jgi:acyl-CoA thioesterase
MSENEVTFESALTLAAAEAGSCRAQIGAEWSQGRAIYGGLVAGLMSRALERALPAERSLRSAVIDFVGPVAPGEATIQTSLLRAGRALTHAEARIVQNGAVCAIMVAAYGERRATSLSIEAAPAPELERAEDLFRLPYVEGAFPRFSKQFEFRVAGGRFAYSGAAEAKVAGYVRYPSGGPIDAAGVLGLLDAWPPPALAKLNRFAPASTVTWMVDIVSDLPARGTQSDAFYRYDATSLAAEGGYASCEARLWGPNGKLVAASRQMIVEFS